MRNRALKIGLTGAVLAAGVGLLIYSSLADAEYYKMVDEAGEVVGPFIGSEPFSLWRLLYFLDFILQPTALFRRREFEACGGLDETLCYAMDWDLWIRLSRAYEGVYIEKALASYRWLGSNKTAEGGFDRLNEVEMVARRYGCNGLPAYFRLELARLLAARAKHNLEQRQFVNMLSSLTSAAATVCTSWRAMRCLVDPHVWRSYRSAQRLYRHVAAGKAERS